MLLDGAGKETDGRNLRRRQVQGKVYIRWGSFEHVVSSGKGARGEDWSPWREGEMINGRSGGAEGRGRRVSTKREEEGRRGQCG